MTILLCEKGTTMFFSILRKIMKTGRKKEAKHLSDIERKIKKIESPEY